MINVPAQSLSSFDVASQPGVREQLARVYNEFRSAQRLSQSVLSEDRASTLAMRTMCPGCLEGSSNATPLFIKNGVCHQKCGSCRLVYTLQTLDIASDSAQYDDTPFMRAYASLKSDPLYARLERSKSLYYLQQALRVRPGLRTLLDIGASTGTMLSVAAEYGLIPYGIEPDTSLSQYLRKICGSKFVVGYFPQDLPPLWPKFDIITLQDVIEHTANPLDFLRTVRMHLGNDGLLFIQVPNYHSLISQLEGQGSTNYCVGHWQHFTSDTLKGLLLRSGFECVQTGTCISEFDRIQLYSQERIDAALNEISEGNAFKRPRNPDDIYDLGLGYKLFGIFVPN